MKVYVAGASRERDRVERILFAVGVEPRLYLTFDWLSHIDEVGAANEGVSRDQRLVSTSLNFQGIAQCDVFVLLIPSVETRGAWVELGYALHMHKPVWVSGRAADEARSIFCVHADKRFLDSASTSIADDLLLGELFRQSAARERVRQS